MKNEYSKNKTTEKITEKKKKKKDTHILNTLRIDILY